jgi:hypothetical protein
MKSVDLTNTQLLKCTPLLSVALVVPYHEKHEHSLTLEIVLHSSLFDLLYLSPQKVDI